MTGILRRVNEPVGNDNDGLKVALVVANLVLFVSVLGVGEIWHYRRLRTEVLFKTSQDLTISISREEFDKDIANGRQLILLDNLVLDVSEFIHHHPGGKFAIRHLVGTDVSKFFFGGYSLENNLTQIARGHKHSAYAKLIVNQLAIAIYESDIEVNVEIV